MVYLDLPLSDSLQKILNLIHNTFVLLKFLFYCFCLETALNKGDNLEGKTVSVEVNKLVPNSAFGYNIQAGKHLNFLSSDNPNVKKGDKLILKVTKVASTLGSYVISYEKQ